MDRPGRALSGLLTAIAKLYRRDAAAYGLACLADVANHLEGLSERRATWPQPATLPVVEHLDAALQSRRKGPLADIVDCMADAAPCCQWRQNANYVADPGMSDFVQRYGYAEIVGSRAFFPSDTLLCGVLLIGPGTTYPRHHHPAEEVYHVLAGTAEWQRGDAAWQSHPAGTAIHHPPMLPHAMRTLDEPLLSLYCWVGNVGVAARLS